MKTIQRLVSAIFLVIAFVGINQLANAQKPPSEKEIAITKLVDSQRYVFYAEKVNPSGGGQKILTSEYTLKVSKDTIICDLPYFGRAYSAPIGTTDGGIVFTTTDFEYKNEPRKKGGWDIFIRPKDVQGGQQVNMTIFSNGNTSVQVTSNNRQPISFNGYIEERKKKK